MWRQATGFLTSGAQGKRIGNGYRFMKGHHLILGQLTDCISGRILDDTLDERHRQQIGRLLVDQKGYPKAEITSRHEVEVRTPDKCARLLVTYMVKLADRIAMLIQYGPGSLVTRHRPALAMARLVAAYQIPVVVVTNGEAADILAGDSGTVFAKGLENIPSRDHLLERIQGLTWPAVAPERAIMEARILMAYEVDDRCPCDDSVCTLGSESMQP
jgi:hypothetical protein